MRERIWRDGLLVVGGLLGLLLIGELWAMAGFGPFRAILGHDYGLYMDATRRWLTGGPFYPAWQVAGPFTIERWPVLYPPQALILLVPFSFLPGPVWVAVPTVATCWAIASHRPRVWALVVMLAIAVVFPWEVFLPYVSGTPTIWIVAFLAIGTRWPAAAALVLLQPTLIPFALVGVRDRRWWWAAGALAVLGLALAPLSLEWIRSVRNLTGSKSGLLYSLENFPPMALPLVAWLGRSGDRAEAADRGQRVGHAPEGTLPHEGRCESGRGAVPDLEGLQDKRA